MSEELFPYASLTQRETNECALVVKCRHLGNEAARGVAHLTNDDLMSALQHATSLRDLLVMAKNAR